MVNTGAASAPLSQATGVYRLDGEVEYDFPAGMTLDAGEKLWLLPFDPTNLTLLTQFDALYGRDDADVVLGPFKGSLSNREGRIALERPQDSDDPERPLDISWVVVDELFYFDQLPWPESADGAGYPLIRTGLTSWSAASATDSDADRIADEWEMDYFGALEQPGLDWDGDGQSNYEEYVADSNPTNAASTFVITGLDYSTLYWDAKSGRTYSVYYADDLSKPFAPIAFGVTDGYFSDVLREGPAYYRIEVEW